jgi:hypothetical protein
MLFESIIYYHWCFVSYRNQNMCFTFKMDFDVRDVDVRNVDVRDVDVHGCFIGPS